MERQIHGFIFEKKEITKRGLTSWNDYITKNPNIETNGGYTSTWDAIDENKKGIQFGGKPVQIKCIKKGSSIDLGDIFRNSSKKENFDLIVGFWEVSKTNIVETYLIEVDYKKWNLLFEWDKYYELRDWISNKVSNHKSYNVQWKTECKKYKVDWGYERIIQPRFKRDSKNQRRIQCGITYNKFIEYIIKKGIVNE
jgi:hypothetical protein